MTSSTVMQPIPVRTRLTVLHDGVPASSCVVFCDASRRTVPVSACATCGHGGAIARDRHGRPSTIGCARVELPSRANDTLPPPSGLRLGAGGVAAVAASLPVGIALVRTIVCVRFDAPLRAAARALGSDGSAYGLPVVDHEARYVGFLPRATATLALAESDTASVAERMTAPSCSVSESASVRDAFAAMGARHARELTVVDDDRRVVGTLRDVDALRFVAHVARTGRRLLRDDAA